MKWMRHLPVKTAQAAWPLVQRFNKHFERRTHQPSWAPEPLLKSREKSFPTLGWPRETDSLCPRCVKEVRTDILSGRRALSELIDGKPGEVRARILERDGQILMEKTCERHGTVTDVMAIDPEFLRRI